MMSDLSDQNSLFEVVLSLLIYDTAGELIRDIKLYQYYTQDEEATGALCSV